MIITIIGPDGSGKSTIAQVVMERLQAQGLAVRHYPFRFGVLPKLSALRFWRGGWKKGTCFESEESYPIYDLSENPPLRTLIYMIWYGLDYLLGGLVLRLRNTFGANHHVAVFARYFHDYYYQSNNRRLPNSIKKAIEMFVPKPSFIFFLYRDPQDIHDGKPELPVCEIEKQQRVIREMLSSYPQFHEIDARSGVEETARKILLLLGFRARHNIKDSRGISRD